MRTLKTDHPSPAPLVRTAPPPITECVFEFITPLFGGGVLVESDELRRQLKQPDAVTPVRGASLRGQLRFWWRALHGCRAASLKDMHAAEERLWGGASAPGRVAISLEHEPLVLDRVAVYDSNESRSGKFNPRARRDMRTFAYAAFPLQAKGGQHSALASGELTLPRGEITLRLTESPSAERLTPTEREQALDAVRAWLSFGGLGGRTRRGFGAVGLLGDDLELMQEVPTLDGALVPSVPSLQGARLRTAGRPGGARDAHENAIGQLQRFRQGVDMGRNPPAKTPGNKKPAGRSRWPEADTIRAMTGQSAPEHRTPLTGVRKFPRADFGLPIIFHYQGRGEPSDQTLQHAEDGKDRFSSPLILRPFARDGRYVAMALHLNNSPTPPAALGNRPVDTELSQAEADQLAPLRMNRAQDPMTAFLNFFANGGRR